MLHAASLYPQEPLDGGDQLPYLLVGFQPILLDGLADAVLDVVLQEDGADLFGGRDDAADLGEYVYAVRLFLDHPLQTPYLPLDAPEACEDLLLIPLLDVAVRGARTHSTLHPAPFLVDLYAPKPQGVAHDGDARERHRRRREREVQEAVLTQKGPQDLGHGPAGEQRVEGA